MGEKPSKMNDAVEILDFDGIVTVKEDAAFDSFEELLDLQSV